MSPQFDNFQYVKFLCSCFLPALFLLASCAKEEVEGFDSQITIAQDFKVDPATGDTFYHIYMANGFTPNGDGRNDLYYAVGIGFDYDNFSMSILREHCRRQRSKEEGKRGSHLA